MPASVGKKVFAKIFLFDRHAIDKWGTEGFPPEKNFEATPSRTLENALV